VVIRIVVAAAILSVYASTNAYPQSPNAQRRFEVASVKPSAPEGGRTVGCDGGPGTANPGTLTCENTTLLMLLTKTFNISALVLQAPDWLATSRFDIIARIPQGTTKVEFLEMCQSLLTDRFKLAVHREEKEVSKYDLVAAKTGIKIRSSSDLNPEDRASPEPPRSHPPMKLDREGFPELNRPGMIGVNGHIRLYDPKMTMEFLASTLSNQLGKPVTDSTGLQGAYEIRLYWVDETLPPSSDNAGPTILRAVQDQLGLRLESKKGPVQFLIVDHVDKVPTEN